MKTSTERILTTHVGSLPRSQEVTDLLFAQDRGEKYEIQNFEAAMRRGVEEVVRLQRDAGIDIVSDGETSKISYATYIRHRLTDLRAIRRGQPRKISMSCPIIVTSWFRKALPPNTCGQCVRVRSKSRTANRCARISRG